MQSKLKKNLLNGKYNLLDKQLGQGGLAKVFEAEDIQTGKKVAIKISHKSFNEDPLVRVLSAHETKTLAQVRGIDNVIQLVDYFEVENKPHIVMELSKGGTLKQLLSKGNIQFQRAVQMFKTIAFAYSEISEKKIVHRDLKPSNILISESGETKIADFGFAILHQDLPKEGKVSAGSHAYRAPETFCKYEYGPKSDIWSLGIIFYEMITGTKPWNYADKNQKLKKISKQPIEKLIPESLCLMGREILMKTLAVSVQERASPQELCQLLLSYQNQSITLSSPPECDSSPPLDPISQQMLNQIDFCRYQYEILKMVCEYSEKIENRCEIKQLSNLLWWNIHRHFDAVEKFNFSKFSGAETREYKASAKYKRILQIVATYRENYSLSLGKQAKLKLMTETPSDQCLDRLLSWLSATSITDYKLFLLYDHLITLRWLFDLRMQVSVENMREVEIKKLVKSLRNMLKDLGVGKKVEGEHLRMLRQKVCELQGLRKISQS